MSFWSTQTTQTKPKSSFWSDPMQPKAQPTPVQNKPPGLFNPQNIAMAKQVGGGLLNMAGQGIKNVASTAFNPSAKLGILKKAVTGQYIAPAIENTAKLGKMTAQGTFAGLSNLGKTGMQAVGIKPPSSSYEQKILGQETKPYQQTYKDIQGGLEKYGATPTQKKSIGLLGIAGLAVADYPGMGAGKQIVKEGVESLGKKVVKEIAERDKTFLSQFAYNVTNKLPTKKRDYETAKNIYKEAGYEVPKTQRQLADFISTVDEANASRAFDTGIEAGYNRKLTPKERPRFIQDELTGKMKGKGLLQKAKDYFTQIPNKQGGFIENPLGDDVTNLSQKTTKQQLGGLLTKETSEQLPKIAGSQSVLKPKVPIQSQDLSLDKNVSESFDPSKYVKEQVAKREGARVEGSPGLIGKVKTGLSDFKAKLVDFSAPIEDTLNEAVKKNKIKLLPEQDIHNQIDRVLRSPTLAGQFAKDNGIVNVIRKVDDLDAFDQYLTAKHAIELDTKGITTGRDIAKDSELIKAFAPKYEADAKIVSQYSQKLLDYSVDTGLISKELADTLKARYPDYVPFQRVFNELEKTQGQGTNAIASLSRQNIVQKIEGSERAIESPIQSLLAKTNDAFKQGEKNLAGKMLAGYEKLPGNPFQIKEIKPELVPVANITHKGQVFPEVMNKIAEVVEKYGGKIERKLKTRSAFGKFYEGENKIVTRFGTSKDTLLHEFGHMLDTKFGLKTSDFFDRTTNVELRNVADLRGGRQAYVRKGEEKIAEFVSMYFSDFKNAQRVAPKTTKKFTEFLRDKPELREITSTMKSRQRTNEMMNETIFRPSVFEPKEPHFTALINGEKKYFGTTKEIADAANSLNVQQLNVLGKIFAFPTRIARLGITGINLPFVGANIAKDQVTAFINSNHGLKTSVANPVNFVRSLFSAVKHDALYQEMVRAGGAGTSFDISRNQVEHTVGSIRAGRNLGTKIIYTVRHPSELLRAVENIIGRGEEFTRIQQYRGTKEALLSKGMTEKSAITAGARAARDSTVNFARRGEWGTVLNSAFLYLNASIQGTRTLLRNLKDKPVQTGVKIAISSMFPVAVATSWNLSDPERKKAYEDIAEYEKENNIIIVPPNPTKDENGKWNVIKIPLSQEINNLVGLVRRPIESIEGLDPLKFGDFAKALVGTVSPIQPTKGSVLSTLTPQAIKPTIEGAVNKNLFTGFPQVSRRLENLSPEKQIKDDTSGFAVKLGQQLGVSPIKIDAFIKGTFGGLGQQLTGQQNIIEAVFARFGKARGGEIENKFYEQEKVEDQIKADKRAEFKTNIYQKAQDLLKNGRMDEADTFVQSLSPEEQELYRDIRTAERSKNTATLHDLLKQDPAEAVRFVRSQNEREKERLVERLNDDSSFSDEERQLYIKGKELQ